MSTKRSLVCLVAASLVLVAFLAPATAEAATFNRVQSVQVTEAAAKAMRSHPRWSRVVSVAGTTVTARPGHAVYTNPGGSVLVMEDEDKPTVTISKAEFWQKFDGQIAVYIACACQGKSDDDCKFEVWRGSEPDVSTCGGEPCCKLYQLIIDMETGQHEVL